MPIALTYKIDVKKIKKEFLFVGEKGTYLDGAFMENKDGVDQYGNHGFITQNIPKANREAGERGPIVGNWKWPKDRPQPPQAAREDVPPDSNGSREKPDDLPF